MTITNFRSHSSSVGRSLYHLCFVVKYRHKIFYDEEVKEHCGAELREAAKAAGVFIVEMGFDVDHVHFVLDTDLKWLPRVVKAMKGRSGRRLLAAFPELKKRKFWGSGLWSPAYFFESLGTKTMEFARGYVRMQEERRVRKKAEASVAGQLTMAAFV